MSRRGSRGYDQAVNCLDLDLRPSPREASLNKTLGELNGLGKVLVLLSLGDGVQGGQVTLGDTVQGIDVRESASVESR
jgi:hypothetical protein